MDKIIAPNCRDADHAYCRAEECDCDCHNEMHYSDRQLDVLLRKGEMAARMEFLAELTQKALKNNDMEIALWLMKHGRSQVGEL